MATIREVENAIKAIVVDAVYPNGTLNPSITGTLVKIRNGWPISEILDKDVLAGNSQITIFPLGAGDKNVTRFNRIWQESSRNAATLFVPVTGNQITVNGTVTAQQQAVTVVLNGAAYGYLVLPTDTLADVANGIAAALPSATAAGNVVTVNTQINTLRAAIAVTGTLALEYKRQQKLFYVSVFCADPETREILGDAVENALGYAVYLNFPDGTFGIINYKAINEQDLFQKNLIYQRDILWSVEYPSMIYESGTEIQSIYANVQGDLI